MRDDKMTTDEEDIEIVKLKIAAEKEKIEAKQENIKTICKLVVQVFAIIFVIVMSVMYNGQIMYAGLAFVSLIAGVNLPTIYTNVVNSGKK